MTGTLAPAEREERIAELARHNRRVLVATDCLSEGINLQDALRRGRALRPLLEPDAPRAARGPRRPLRAARAQRTGRHLLTARTRRSTGSCSTCCCASTSGSASRSASPSRSRPTPPPSCDAILEGLITRGPPRRERLRAALTRSRIYRRHRGLSSRPMGAGRRAREAHPHRVRPGTRSSPTRSTASSRAANDATGSTTRRAPIRHRGAPRIRRDRHRARAMDPGRRPGRVPRRAMKDAVGLNARQQHPSTSPATTTTL